MTTPSLNLPGNNMHDLSLASKLGNSVSASTTPLLQQHQQGLAYLSSQGTLSRRGSPPSMTDTLSSISIPRSVPTTPLPGLSGTPSHLMKAPGTPLSADTQGLSGRLSSAGIHSLNDMNGGDLRPSLSRLSSQFDNGSMGFNNMQPNLDDSMRVCLCLLVFKAWLTFLSNNMVSTRMTIWKMTVMAMDSTRTGNWATAQQGLRRCTTTMDLVMASV